METPEQVRGMARQLVCLAKDGDIDRVSGMVHLLTDPTARQQELLRQVLTELLAAAAAMMVRQIGGAGANTAVVLDLRRVDGTVVDIDQLQPEVRAVVRALLAQVNGHSGDTADQITLALAGDPGPLVDGIVLVLVWTICAMTWCEDNDEPAPGWLTSTAA